MRGVEGPEPWARVPSPRSVPLRRPRNPGASVGRRSSDPCPALPTAWLPWHTPKAARRASPGPTRLRPDRGILGRSYFQH